jgi:hypothetical protein
MIDGDGAPVKASRCTNQEPMASYGNIQITGFLLYLAILAGNRGRPDEPSRPPAADGASAGKARLTC